jgi:hypothetical protein
MKAWNVLLIGLFLFGCGIAPNKPKSVLEQIEAAEITAQQVEASILNLTCTKFAAKKCIEPGKALMPDKGMELFSKAEEVRAALRTATSLGVDKIGICMGQNRNQVACLSAARVLLLQLETYLLNAKRSGT